MNKIKDLLKHSNQALVTVEPNTLIYGALKQMEDSDIGCVLVVWEGTLIGIMSERDYARKVVLKGNASWKTKVEKIMRTEFPVVSPESSLDEALALLSQYKVRYLPVLEGRDLIGLISIHDVLNAVIDTQLDNIELLNKYVYNQM